MPVLSGAEMVQSFGPIAFGLASVFLMWERIVRPELRESSKRIAEATSAAQAAAAAAEKAAASAERAVQGLARCKRGRGRVR